MKYIIQFLCLSIFTVSINGDTVGVDMDKWVAQNDSSIDPQIIQEVKSEVVKQKSNQKNSNIITQTNYTNPQSKIVSSQNSIKDKSLGFFEPIIEFAKKYTTQFISIIFGTILLSYLLIFLPIIRSIKKELENDEIEIKNHTQKKIESKQDRKILSNIEFNRLKSELNESFIYNKEEVLLSKDMTQDEKNKELVILEWKYNQILNVSLPKLESQDPKEFSQGLKELLDEKESREITRLFFKEFLENKDLDKNLTIFIKDLLRKG